MSRIKVLSEILQNKIAAGEVVERPASIVKELIENSLDAESSDIRIEILKGGKKLLKVDDDGIGMDREDALLCFQKHATSKIYDERDLSAITTLGFRGEALSSITSVAKVKIKTAFKHMPVGTYVEISGGDVKAVKDISAAGTTIEVRDLFFNTPVRKKFLKTDHTEQYHIIDTVTRTAIIHPQVRFSLSDAGRSILSLTRAVDIKERIAQVFGIKFMEGLTEVCGTDDHARMSLEGFVSRPGNVRKRRANQYLFVNRRPIMDTSLRHAIYRAFEGYIDSDSHPVYVLHLTIDTGNIDVNVHPTKREVRFIDKETMYEFFMESIRNTLGRASVTSSEWDKTLSLTVPGRRGPAPGSKEKVLYEKMVQMRVPVSVAETIELSYEVDRPFLYLGDVFIAYAEKDGLCIIDHHAAHERIMYEKLMAGMSEGTRALLFPKQIRLSAKEYGVILNFRDVLLGMGFEIEDFGGNTIIIRAIPEGVEEGTLDSLLNDMASSFMDCTASSPVADIRDAVAKRIACHSSVRGRKILGKEQIIQLLRDLDNTKDPHHCPHGRPTRIYFPLHDLRKRFERT